MLTKVKTEYRFNPKRNKNLTTPCCKKDTKDCKFATFINLPDYYGKCFSCGTTTLPPTIYKDENNKEFIWNKNLNKFEDFTDSLVSQCIEKTKHTINKKRETKQKYINESIIWDSFNNHQENNLLKYLRTKYPKNKVDEVKELYIIGTDKYKRAIFWQINKNLKVQKNKICIYDTEGKRSKTWSEFKNNEGYFSCLYGEHLLIDSLKDISIAILVEGEKTAIVGQILFPKYTWLAYGGSTALTDYKIKTLIGYKVLIIPDISLQAVSIIEKKIPFLRGIGINASIWDMRNGYSDEELKQRGLYNLDLEDVFRSLKNTKSNNAFILNKQTSNQK